MTSIRLRRLPHAHDLPLPSRQTEHSAGFDLRAAVESEIEIKPGDILLVETGFEIEIPHGFEAQIRARSGLAVKHGITLINAIGTIDSDYRGELKVPLINHGSASHVIHRGDRIAQMILIKLPESEVIEVETLSDTTRGSGGFGHTGR